ncbi:hypothetical protein PRZ48_009398 [Zasmidium cellare]|uniref:Uncharacterized protein n=1 Tax=Zasmidium cellare TaxID=395010 RepID=A0ABR0ECE7_ZASCE|nr:hypothetical protein PRZ48_009398 [Zasmidium cellare]
MKFSSVLRQRRLAQSKAQGPPRLPHPKDIFPFFRLPLELREAIYDETLEDRDEQLDYDKTLKYQACSTPLVNLLRVSKRVKQEYEARARKKMSFRIDDMFGETSTGPCLLPEAAVKIPLAVASIVVFHRRYGKEFDMHRKWLLELIKQFKTLECLRLTIKVARDSLQENKARVEGFLRWLSATLTAAFVAEVHGAEYDFNDETEMKKEFFPMMRWSYEKGKLEDIKEEELKDEEN